MNRRFESHLFWGSHSPLSILSGTGLIVLASGRFAFALICTGAVIWVFGLSALIYSCARPILPERGRNVILLFLSSFLCGIFMFLVGLLNPLLIMSTFFFLLLVPPFCLGSGFFEASRQEYPVEVISRALLEAGVLGGIVLAISLIREPLGLGSLSFPGGAQGVTELFGGGEEDFAPFRLLSMSAGGLLLLGYLIALFRFIRERSGGTPREEDREAAK